MKDLGQNDEPFFWMGGRLAYDLVEITNDTKSLADGEFWAVTSTFEGQWICAKFATVTEAPLPLSEDAWVGPKGAWNSTLNSEEYTRYVDEIRRHISLGWVYQVNACRQLSIIRSGGTLLPLMHELLTKNPAPYASYLRLPSLEIASASPELFLHREENTVSSAPIKGTKHLDDVDVNFGEKDQAENIMIVDLIRNDLGRICKTGSVRVPELLQSQVHPGLSHLVSFVEGEVIEGLPWNEILESVLPPGSVSGAPKSSALQIISLIETLPRGPYCGALGWIQGKRASLSVAIRIFWDAQDGYLRFGTGAGITWGSDALKEWEETQLKARRLISIAGGHL